MATKRYGYPCGCEVALTKTQMRTTVCEQHPDRTDWDMSEEYRLCEAIVYVTLDKDASILVVPVYCQMPIGHEGSHVTEVYWDAADAPLAADASQDEAS